eukprot:115717_1
MSQVNLVELFIKIIGFYGFRISKELVNKIIDASKINKQSNKHLINVKPVIGIHFDEKCCLNNDQIIKYYVSYMSNRTGWSHYCVAHKSSIYLNNEFGSKIRTSKKK